jgi:NAD(P)-dependent dehydrogenase (short-subunit alcohol dehydrogenase family)
MNQSAVVTGAAQGIGRAAALRLLAQGWDVVGIDIDGLGLADDVWTTAGSGSFFALVGDVADSSTHASAAEAAESMSPLRGWFNNAGYNIMGSVAELGPEAYERGLDVVLGGVFRGTAEACRHMQDTGGAIVNMASIQGLMGFPGFAAYATCKAGIVGLTRQVAAEYASRGVRCNAVSPGLIATDLATRTLAEAADPEAVRAAWDVLCPIGRWGTPEDVAAAVSFLLSEEAGFITGHNLVIDGGATVLARGQE